MFIPQLRNYHLLPLLSSFMLFTGCTSHHQEHLNEAIVNDTYLHPYNTQYGLVEDPHVDTILVQEEIASVQPAETITIPLENPTYTTELKDDPEAFVAEEWVEPEPVITYKYDDDPRFYREDELPENKFKLGNVIVKVPEGADKNTLLQGIEYASTPQSGY